jgi:lipopolysaccharide transport system permease protein
MSFSMSGLLKSLIVWRELMLVLVSRNLKIRYKSSALGFFWSFLSPLLLICIYYFFLSVMRFEIDIKLLVTGVIAWQFFSMSLNDSLHAIVGNSNLVTKSAFPRIILPISTVTANLVNYLLSTVILVIYLVIAGADFSSLYWYPVVLLTNYALCLGMALMLSTANVFFRDVEHILSVVMLAWFFVSPVMYPLAQLMDKFKFNTTLQYLYFLNPMAGIITGYHAAFLSVKVPDFRMLLISFAIAWSIFGVGVAVFEKAQGKFGDEL